VVPHFSCCASTAQCVLTLHALHPLPCVMDRGPCAWRLQLISPTDALVAKAILANLAPWDKAAYETATLASVQAHPLFHDPTAALVPAYFAKVASSLSRHAAVNASNAPGGNTGGWRSLWSGLVE
jgi:hypothetical protein